MKNYDIFPAETKTKVLKIINDGSSKFEKLLENSYKNHQIFKSRQIKLIRFEKEILKLFEKSIFLCIGWLDISLDMSNYLKTENNYNRISALRNLTIHLNEGYKKIYHFTESKRNQSLWMQNIAKICEEKEFEDFNSQIKTVTDKLISYEEEYQNDILKNNRDTFVHYQGSPIKLYEDFNNINVFNLIKNTTDYLYLSSEILNLMTDITNRITKNYSLS